ncbi:hypothetical protein GCM10009839_66410 [Catenulispora yoronensis]|uniref:Uncharacterized protein n=1 Tax=Catenulispora yoronensis TaxID=450799 RepID=A0ABN2V4R6_9ACTN
MEVADVEVVPVAAVAVVCDGWSVAEMIETADCFVGCDAHPAAIIATNALIELT